MFKKSDNKLFSRRKRGSPAGSIESISAELMQELSAAEPDESEASRLFRATVIQKLSDFKHEADLLVNGVADISDTWTDVLGAQGIAGSAAVIAGVIGLLGGLMVLSAALSAGLAIPIAVVGVIAGIAFWKYRDVVKQERYNRATEALDRDDFDGDIRRIANLLADLYRLQLESSTIKDARSLAEACVKAMSEEMLRNESFAFDELLYQSSLQGVLMRAGNRLPKIELDMNLLSNRKFNTRGMIRHTALYCRETDEFYKTSLSKARKYGVLYFDRKKDLEDYQAILASNMPRPNRWKLRKMREYEVGILKRSSIFKAYKNDAVFENKPVMSVVDNDNNKKVTP